MHVESKFHLLRTFLLSFLPMINRIDLIELMFRSAKNHENNLQERSDALEVISESRIESAIH
jgi:hypothetical protein